VDQRFESLEVCDLYTYICVSDWRAPMVSSETNTRKITARLSRDGWTKLPGGKHDKYEHPAKPGVLIVVPRHKEQSPGVARDIAKLAGWA
jgi:predicted RNA binding protein YcfA (HicA-like mRNA interferase family)